MCAAKKIVKHFAFSCPMHSKKRKRTSLQFFGAASLQQQKKLRWSTPSSMCGVHNIPVEMIAHIVSFVAIIPHGVHLSPVSKQWHAAVQNCFNIALKRVSLAKPLPLHLRALLGNVACLTLYKHLPEILMDIHMLFPNLKKLELVVFDYKEINVTSWPWPTNLELHIYGATLQYKHLYSTLSSNTNMNIFCYYSVIEGTMVFHSRLHTLHAAPLADELMQISILLCGMCVLKYYTK